MVLEVSDLVAVAARLRATAGQTEPAFSTRAIVDACFPDAIVTGRRLPAGIHEAVSRTAAGTLIIYQRDLPTPDQRFAIAHALAHVLFDDARSACRVGFVGDPEAEARADRFAAELLAPLADLIEYVGRQPSDDSAEHEFYLDMVDEIASHFHVPSRVVDMQVRELISRGMIS